MAELILGPMLRYVDAESATVWVETDVPCEVEVLGVRSRTFCVGGHHYGLIAITGLAPGSTTAYDVTLDGERHWPAAESDLPPSVIRTLPVSGPVSILWGSCRVTAPHHPPFTLDVDEHPRGSGVDALYALVQRLAAQPSPDWPDLLLMIGDQVYADEVSPLTRAFIDAGRDTTKPPGEEVRDFTEYTRLYQEAWSQPSIRWLHSVVPAAMIFDDHDVHDDWNTSEAWAQDARATDWWQERIIGALSSYWLYQHLGNLSPAELEADELLGRVRRAGSGDGDAEPLLREFAIAADRDWGGSLWSYSRDIAGTRLVVMDSREGRVLESGRREMLDEGEWRWLTEQVRGDHDHLLLASTLPILLAPTLHYVEAWNEALCAGRWGGLVARLSEKLRRGLDLEHWAAFQTSFHRLIELVTEVGSGACGAPPASIVMLGGDVHQAYLETVRFDEGAPVVSRVYQAVCSPFRNQLGARERRMLGIARRSRIVGWLARRLAGAAGVAKPAVSWDVLQPPTWRNQLGWLRIDGRRIELTIESTGPGAGAELLRSLQHTLA